MLTFSMLFLTVLAPLNEIHRFVDEAHENSLRVGDLLAMLDEPADRSFHPAHPIEPRLAPRRTALRGRQPPRQVQDARRQDPPRPRRPVADDPPRRDDRRRRPLGLRQVDLAPRDDAAGPSQLAARPTSAASRSSRSPARRSAGSSATSARTRSSSPGTIAENIAYGNDGATREQIEEAAPPGLPARRDRGDARRLRRRRLRAGPEPLRRPAAAAGAGPDLPQEPARS